MIEFFPVVRLRKMGKNYELKEFEKLSNDFNSIDKFVAGILYRFTHDNKCPAIFIKLPKAGDEPIEGVKYQRDYTFDEFINVLYKFTDKDDVARVLLSDTVVMLYKLNFVHESWDNYTYYLSGKEGISIKMGGKNA